MGLHNAPKKSGPDNPQYKRFKTNCAACGSEIIRRAADFKNFEYLYCNNACRAVGQTLNRSGEKAANWKGGLSRLPYPAEFNDPIKRLIRQRDNHTCQVCKKGRQLDRNLDVHHIDYDKSNCHPSNLLATCHGCNTRLNFNRDYWRNRLQDYQRQRGL
jgi:hypothetical protein